MIVCGNADRQDMVRARNDFKTSARRCRYDHAKQQTTKMMQLENKNARDYWKLLKGHSKSNYPNIRNNELYAFFESISKPEDVLMRAAYDEEDEEYHGDLDAQS